MDLDPTTNPNAQKALSRAQSNRTVVLLPLDDGDIAIFDRSYALHAIVDEAISHERLSALSDLFFNKLANRTQEARFYGEPDDRSFAKDLKNGRQPPRTTREQGQIIDIEF